MFIISKSGTNFNNIKFHVVQDWKKEYLDPVNKAFKIRLIERLITFPIY